MKKRLHPPIVLSNEEGSHNCPFCAEKFKKVVRLIKYYEIIEVPIKPRQMEVLELERYKFNKFNGKIKPVYRSHGVQKITAITKRVKRYKCLNCGLVFANLNKLNSTAKSC